MIFRTRDAATSTGPSDLDVVLTVAEATFGRYPDALDGATVTVAGRRFILDPSRSPAFVREPSCDRCGVRPPEQFPLTVDVIGGAEVWVQTHDTCRDCRFVLLASAPADRSPSLEGAVLELRARERRLERRARRRARRDARSLI